MYVEPAVYQHVEVMLGLARRDTDEGTAAAELAAELALSATTVANLLRNLTAAGLLWARPSDGGPRFGLLRAPHAITLAEVSAVAERAGASPSDRRTVWATARPQAGIAALSDSIDACTQRLMAGVTVADLLADGSVARAPEASREMRETRDGRDDTRGAVAVDTLWTWARGGRPHVVLDVRAEPGADWAAPPWARWMPLERLPWLQARLPRDRPIVAVCATGARSEMAAQYLRTIGFEHAWALAGGLVAWQSTRPRP